MTEPDAAPPESPPLQPPGERRLPHPPSDRYRTPDPVATVPDPDASVSRGVVYGVAAAVIGAAAMIVLGGVLAVSAGLLVVAGATGWAVAVGVRAGAGQQLATGRRVRIALLLAAVAVAGGQVGLWLYALSEGGVLGPVAYLAETFGVLVPLELFVAWIVAWATAR